MTLLVVLIMLLTILFKDQTKQILEALVRLIIAIADTIVSSIK